MDVSPWKQDFGRVPSGTVSAGERVEINSRDTTPCAVPCVLRQILVLILDVRAVRAEISLTSKKAVVVVPDADDRRPSVGGPGTTRVRT